MSEALSIGTIIKNRRLELNLRMEDVAKKANITRSTLWIIEKGSGNYSFQSLLSVLNVLGLSLSIDGFKETSLPSLRASRLNTARDKKINRFIVMCVEQYTLLINKSSKVVYKQLLDGGVIDELKNDYEDLHGMSTEFINSFIDALLEGSDL